jgi:hypothetical protein
MFSPTLGRFVQPDPIGFDAGDVDLYRAEGNRPTNEVDPSGCDYPPGGWTTEDRRWLYEQERKRVTTVITLGGGSISATVWNNHGGVTEPERAKVPDIVKEAISRITTANHLLVYHWDCIMKILAEKKDKVQIGWVYRALRDNKEYYMKRFQRASDRILNGGEITFYITDQTETNAKNARSYPTLGYVSLRKGFFEELRTDQSVAIRTMAHELGAMFGGQGNLGVDKGSDDPIKVGDVRLWDLIIEYLNQYKDEICACEK